ncbi:unnamed protein product [Cylindrotheca closterium]|uniref:Uncharacterized protein n=1 Tax=Cylindrotheca closterium TaxID=2856 RepID=A0AAD2CFU2_9STRA|nr:unnamed protein product [Cylindrotheca closterium]
MLYRYSNLSSKSSNGMAYLWLFMLPLCWQCQQLVCQAETATHVSIHNAQQHLQQLQRSLRVSQDENDQGLEYKIPKFSILLEPTPHEITDDMVASVLSPILEETLFDSLGGVQTQSNRLLLAQAYVEEQQYENDGENTNTNTNTNTNNTTLIIVKGGLVNFKRTPPLEKVPEVIEDGINFKLVNNLPKDSIFFGSIERATFVGFFEPQQPLVPDDSNNNNNNINNDDPPQNNPPGLISTVSPSNSPATVSNNKSNNLEEQVDGNDNDEHDDLTEWMIKIVGGTIAILLGFGLLFLAQKQRSKRQHEESQALKNMSFETAQLEGLDMDDDEEDDAKSMATTETQNHQYLAKSQYLASEETFERNSKLAVKKDMLESEWSTYNPNARAAAAAATNVATSSSSTSGSTEFEAGSSTTTTTTTTNSQRSLV